MCVCVCVHTYIYTCRYIALSLFLSLSLFSVLVLALSLSLSLSLSFARSPLQSLFKYVWCLIVYLRVLSGFLRCITYLQLERIFTKINHILLIHMCHQEQCAGHLWSVYVLTFYVQVCMHNHTRVCRYTYGVATMSRLLQIIGLFCKRALQNRLYFAKETYNFKKPTNRSHPICVNPSWNMLHTYKYVRVHMCKYVHVTYVHMRKYVHVTYVHMCKYVHVTNVPMCKYVHVTYVHVTYLSLCAYFGRIDLFIMYIAFIHTLHA